MTLSKKITFPNFEIEISDFGFYKVSVNDSEEFTVDDLKKLVNAEAELGGEKLPVLVLCAEHATTNSELMNAMAKNINNPYSKADAFVIKINGSKNISKFLY